MSRALALRLVILPQAMRAIIPPTGNEVISMLKPRLWSPLCPTFDLYARAAAFRRTFSPVPMLLIASTWYLLFTSILMVGQHYLGVTSPVVRRGSCRTGNCRHWPTRRTTICSGRQMTPMVDAQNVCKGFGALDVLRGVCQACNPAR